LKTPPAGTAWAARSSESPRTHTLRRAGGGSLRGRPPPSIWSMFPSSILQGKTILPILK
uniref:Uncharacterized protein n=1 Tax=Mustela putorius furo TaxID=9669 RepID=M3XML4_MUSPF